MNIKFHTAANGQTGYANHANAFWSRLSKKNDGQGIPINIILDTTDHPFFYKEYDGLKIAYNVWESTKQPDHYFNHILNNYDQMWVASNWQRQCTIDQGFPADRVKVVPEGIDNSEFFPVDDKELSPIFTFMIFGKWEYRKATEEMINCWLEEFPRDKYPYVKLVLSVDNNFDKENVQNKLANLPKDSRIEILHFPPRKEYIRRLQTGHVFLSCARAEGWNLPLIEAIACGVPTICTDYGAQLDFAKDISNLVDIKHMVPAPFGFPGEYAEPNFDSFKKQMKMVYQNFPFCRKKALDGAKWIVEDFNWEKAVDIAYKHLQELETKITTPIITSEKPQLVVDKVKDDKVNIVLHFVQGPYIEIKGHSPEKFKVEFDDVSAGRNVYTDILSCGGWARPNKPKYFTDWHIKVTTLGSSMDLSKTKIIKGDIKFKEGEEIINHKFDPSGKRVFIVLTSKALGDTIAWIPYVEEFRKKYKDCKVICSTFWKKLFVNSYPEIEFVDPGTTQHNLYAMVDIGCFDNNFALNKFAWRSIPLQKVASDALNLEFREIVPRIDVDKSYDEYINKTFGEKPYVCISEHSTIQNKYWNFPGGWQIIVDYLHSCGYNVIGIDKTKPNIVKNRSEYLNRNFSFVPDFEVIDQPIEKTAAIIAKSKFFMGIGSGSSWLAWGLRKPVILISGFSDPFVEFVTNGCRRIAAPPGKCHGCFNDMSIPFERGVWDYCPYNKHFECTKSITPEMVINEIDQII